ncbi:hypothetical protein BH11PAT2_BH11PAT2_07310 [soil metagenome]
MTDTPKKSPQGFDFEKLRAWVQSDEGRAEMRASAERAHQATAHLRPGTPEYYQEQLVQQEALRLWDAGPFI